MKLRNTVGKFAVLVVALAILAIGVTGSWMMFNAVRHDNINNDLFMEALAYMMLAVTCWIPVRQLLKIVTRNTNETIPVVVKNTKAGTKLQQESLFEITGKMLAFKKEVGQQA